MAKFSYKKFSKSVRKALCCAFAAVAFASAGAVVPGNAAGQVPARAKTAHAIQFDNAARPAHLAGHVTLPATSHFPQKSYRAGSGGINEKFPSLPYGTHRITGTHRSAVIGRLSGDPDVFDIQDMHDKKVQRMRVRMALHKATEKKLVSMGCVAIEQTEYRAFKKHLNEALKEYGELAVTLMPPGEGQKAVFRIKPVSHH